MATQAEKVQMRIHHEDGMYWVDVPAHPGLFASGETMDEVLVALAEAWELYFDAEPGTTRLRLAAQPVDAELVPA
ncbi:MAG TPA: type II toxin-antitoxin system HicB family antitoxin [Solirubrobacteraceae bacterium]|nr:type II toxin-antitoxin system HicB family antitoxin [Solirubrobacteraceae bacterium]